MYASTAAPRFLHSKCCALTCSTVGLKHRIVIKTFFRFGYEMSKCVRFLKLNQQQYGGIFVFKAFFFTERRLSLIEKLLNSWN